MTVLRSLLQTVEIAPGIPVEVLRLDLLHPLTGGNKLFKLKYNLLEADATDHKTILTFGGPFSNHIAATAEACREASLNSIGVIRGMPVKSETLELAEQAGMKLMFVSREEYKLKSDLPWLDKLKKKKGDFLVVPEGGANENGRRGCGEILQGLPEFDYVFCACGTGTTYAGLRSAKPVRTTLIGISVLKGENLLPLYTGQVGLLKREQAIGGDEVLDGGEIRVDSILGSYSFSGYARYDDQLVEFKSEFEKSTGVPLDYIYTTKLFFAVRDLIARGKLSRGSRVLVIHSGGLQGNRAFEQRYQRKLRR